LHDDEIKNLKDFQENVFDEVAKQIEEWGIEKNEKGWMAKYYLYCNETVCPHCKTKVPIASSWLISNKTKTIGLLNYNEQSHNYNIEIIQSPLKVLLNFKQKHPTYEYLDILKLYLEFFPKSGE
jgi:hypothetical protein